MTRIIFGSTPESTHTKRFEDFKDDALDLEWDTPSFLLVGNDETGTSVKVEEIENPLHLSSLVREMGRMVDNVTWVAIYAEGFGQTAPEGQSLEEASQNFQNRDTSKDDEVRMVTYLAKDFQATAVYSRTEEKWVTDSQEETDIYNPRTHTGEQYITIRTELGW